MGHFRFTRLRRSTSGIIPLTLLSVVLLASQISAKRSNKNAYIGDVTSSDASFLLEDLNSINHDSRLPSADTTNDEDATYKEQDNWWRDPLSHFNELGEIIAPRKRSMLPFGTRRSSSSRKSRRIKGKEKPQCNTEALTIASHLSVMPKIIITNPLVMTTAVVAIYYLRANDYTYDDMREMFVNIRRKLSVPFNQWRGGGNGSKTSTQFGEESTHSNKVGDERTTQIQQQPKSRWAWLFSDKTQSAEADSLESKVQELLSRTAAAERERYEMERKYELLKSKVEKLAANHVELIGHLKQTRQMVDGVRHLPRKVDKLSTQMSKSPNIGNNGAKTNQPSYTYGSGRSYSSY